MIKMKKSLPTVSSLLEKAFLLSPFTLLILAIFNVEDTKSLLSRLITVVALYCIVRYPHAFKVNLKNDLIRKFILMNVIICLTFLVFTLTRGDSFSFGRTLFTSLVYLVLVPWWKIGKAEIKLLLVSSGVLTGGFAILDVHFYGASRAGLAINPLPYALFCALISLVNISIAIRSFDIKWRLWAFLGFLSSSVGLILTDARGVIVFFPFVVSLMAFKMLPRSRVVYGLLITLAIGLTGTFYYYFNDKITNRLSETYSEYIKISKGNYLNSIGTRLVLWEFGGEKFAEKPIFGTGDEVLDKEIKTIPHFGARVQAHLHNQYIDTAVRYGVVGAGAMFAWFLLPLLIHRRINEGKVPPELIFSMLMIALAALTDPPFHHTHFVYFYSILTGMSLIFTKDCGGVNRCSN